MIYFCTSKGSKPWNDRNTFNKIAAQRLTVSFYIVFSAQWRDSFCSFNPTISISVSFNPTSWIQGVIMKNALCSKINKLIEYYKKQETCTKGQFQLGIKNLIKRRIEGLFSTINSKVHFLKDMLICFFPQHISGLGYGISCPPEIKNCRKSWHAFLEKFSNLTPLIFQFPFSACKLNVIDIALEKCKFDVNLM